MTVKFLVDAQLPGQMAEWLRAAGLDAIHTDDLPDVDRTPDEAIIEIADAEDRVVVSKDWDFVDLHLLLGRPTKLLHVSTGNIRNRELKVLMVPLIPDIVREFGTHAFLELGLNGLISRD